MHNSNVLSASTLVDDSVTNPQGEDLGKIEDLIIDLKSGRVAYAVLSCGGFLGVGSKLHAVPWSALDINPQNNGFILDVDKKTLENAPGFERDQWPDMADSNWGAQIHSYFGYAPYWTMQ